MGVFHIDEGAEHFFHVAQGIPSVDSTGANAAGTPITTGGTAAAAAPASTTRATGGGAGSFPGLSGARPQCRTCARRCLKRCCMHVLVAYTAADALYAV